MRPITESDIPEVFELVAHRWRRVPELKGFPLYDGRGELTAPAEYPIPRANLVVWAHNDAGVKLWVTAWDVDRQRLERFRDDLPLLFADGPLVWDGVPLRGGVWSFQISDPNPGEPSGEWSDDYPDPEPQGADVPEAIHLLSAETHWWAPDHWHRHSEHMSSVLAPTLGFPIVIDAQTQLRVLSEADGPEFHGLLVANLPHLRPWFDFARAQQPYEESLAFLRCTRQRFAEGGGFWTGVWHAGALAGAVGLTNFDAANASAEMSYWLSASATGKGLATRSCAALLDYLFAQRLLRRVGIRCAADNARSRRLAERLGFKQEGVLRDAEKFEGAFRDVVVYGLLAREWREK